MSIKPGDKIKVIKEYSGYPGTLGKIFTVYMVSNDCGVDTVERQDSGYRYTICSGEYEKWGPRQLTFIFKE